MESCRICVGLVLATLAASSAGGAGDASHNRRAAIHALLPLGFVPNHGQADPAIAFTALGRGFGAFLAPSEVALVRTAAAPSRAASVLRMRLAGASPWARMAGLDQGAARASFFLGRDPGGWSSDLPVYARVRAAGVYPGVDVVYYGNPDELEYDFVVAAGADPGRILLEFPDVDSLELEAGGDAVAERGGARLRLRRPAIYQEEGGARREVAGAYARRGERRLGFRLGAYDTRRPLVIDPVLVYSSHFGGDGDETGLGIAVDEKGALYLTGSTTSVDFPGRELAQAGYGGGASDAFVAKLDRKGALVYFAYLGGSEADVGNAIAVDHDGRVYVTGHTDSSDFPTARAFQPASGGARDAFVARLSASGSRLVYSTYLGGTGGDVTLGIALDARRNAYVTGVTTSGDFPTRRPMQPSYAGGLTDGFVTKLGPSGALLYSTYLGGGNFDAARGIAVTPKGSAHVVGNTFSTDYPTSPARPLPAERMPDAFVTRLDPKGAITWSVPLGGSSGDVAFGVALDAKGNAHVVGFTGSSDFPTRRPAQPGLGGGADAFVTKLDRAGRARYSTFLGGTGTDFGQAIAVDRRGAVYVTGQTQSLDFPAVHAVQEVFGGGSSDAFAAKLKESGSALVYSTYLGGSASDGGQALAVGCGGRLYLTGGTTSIDFPMLKPQQEGLRGLADAFVASLASSAKDARRDRCRDDDDDDEDDDDDHEDDDDDHDDDDDDDRGKGDRDDRRGRRD